MKFIYRGIIEEIEVRQRKARSFNRNISAVVLTPEEYEEFLGEFKMKLPDEDTKIKHPDTLYWKGTQVYKRSIEP